MCRDGKYSILGMSSAITSSYRINQGSTIPFQQKWGNAAPGNVCCVLITALSVWAMIKLLKKKCSTPSDEFHFSCLLFMLKVCLWGASVCIKWRYSEARRGSRRALKWITVAVNVNWCCSRNHDWSRLGLSPHNLPHSGECITLHFHTFRDSSKSKHLYNLLSSWKLRIQSRSRCPASWEISRELCVVSVRILLSFLKCGCRLLITLQGRSSL